ncbi:hypothetical protein BD310DRAFT_255958 [Dichomitus squalens]|uniref:Uncharacterized protein n=1 Tax=Dichomitus squalens TaxID=114155 RepID=A0A4Q9Q1Q1_9APHY|nr:hypothetical protein BD310DRAFT_255958 [Dichomitus squalens]
MEQRRSRSEANDFVWEQGDSSGFEAMLNTITRVFSNAHISSSEMQRAVLSSVAAVFGADTLPPMYRLDEEDEDEEDVVNVVATESTGDESTTEQVPPLSQPWNDWLAEPYVTIPSQEDVVLDDDVSEIPGLGIFSGMSGLPPAVGSPVSVAASTLDPTVFVPSHVDNLRPLPPGPETDAAQFERLFRELEEDYRSGQGHALADAEASSSPRQLDGPQARPSDEVPVHDADPPFMTDGRGRVVWSSTSSSRSRGRGRAVSSSATILPHTKSTIDITPAEESSEGQSQRDTEDSRLPSSSRSLVRRQSVPLLVSDAGAGAEFVTDGRGGVVFASNNH